MRNTAKFMRTCRTCGFRYWRLHTWDECSRELERAEQRAREAESRHALDDAVRRVFSSRV